MTAPREPGFYWVRLRYPAGIFKTVVEVENVENLEGEVHSWAQGIGTDEYVNDDIVEWLGPAEPPPDHP